MIPAVRLARITGQYFATSRPLGEYLGTLPCLALGLTLDGLGQFVGYALGAGRTVDSIAALELQRIDHITDPDRRALFPPDALRVKLTRRAS